MNVLYDLYNSYNIFEENGLVDNSENIDNETVLLPIYHWNMEVKDKNIMEVRLNDRSEFIGCRFLKNGEWIIFPVSEDSLNRTSGAAPHPICDWLTYMLDIYGEEKERDNKYQLYIDNLAKWVDFNEKNEGSKLPKIVYKYIQKGKILKDIMTSINLRDVSYEIVGKGKKTTIPVTYIEERNNKLVESKIKDFGKTFITFFIEGDKRLSTTKSRDFHKDYIRYYQSILDKEKNKRYCILSGEETYCGEKYKGFQGSGSKIISISNNKEVYTGRFLENKKNINPGIVNLGYKSVTKALNMLKYYTDNKQTSRLISEGSYLLNWTNVDDWELKEELDEIMMSSVANHKLGEMIGGIREKKIRGEFTILIVDKVSSGRSAIKYFRKLQASDLQEKIIKWYEDCKWPIYIPKIKETRETVIPIFAYPHYIYGIEDKERRMIKCNNESLIKVTRERLIPCLIEGKRLPLDMVNRVINNLSNRLSYSESGWRRIVDFSCSILKKYTLDYRKGEVKTMFDPDYENRSYLFGRLLAVYEKLERDTFEEEEKNKRQTNVHRYWDKFINKPADTLMIIEKNLIPYINKNKSAGYYQKLLNEIMEKLDSKDEKNNKKLDYNFIFGYRHQSNELYKARSDKK